MTKCIQEIELPSLAATEKLGQALARTIEPGLVIYLEGDLGAGKTTLARALIHALGHRGSVKSPTYAIVELYVISRLYLYHFDFYRFTSPEEFLDAGLGEYFCKDAVCLVEWPDKAGCYLPKADLVLALRPFAHADGEGRLLALDASSQEGARCLNRFFSAWGAGNSSASEPD
ncbi:MAG: tRNA (adenosine(37)-N6)-threonylcarbamoyltransferase complex ATPase subunit type 1 TsaE [Zoogloeaceae bacterium]|nr:tRNA (adenosine(37)-N6)-threonylcarbamoyltransferase complex ATPase subunit type 1 TsaE [Zoogloeaceae bacterium]